MKVRTKYEKKAANFILSYQHTSADAIAILEMLGNNFPQVTIINETKFKKSKVNYWTKKFLLNELIKLDKDGSPKLYRLTPLGVNFITRGERGSSWCIMEDFPFKYPLIHDYGRFAWKKLGEPRNWEKHGILVGSVTVEKTSKSIIIHTGQIIERHPDMCKIAAGEIRGSVRAWLETHGVVMGSICQSVRKPIFKYFTKEAELLHDAFGNISTADGTLDASPPDKLPHEEYDRQTAINKLGEANRLARMEAQQSGMANDVTKTKDDVKELKALMSELIIGLAPLKELKPTLEKLNDNLVSSRKPLRGLCGCERQKSSLKELRRVYMGR